MARNAYCTPFRTNRQREIAAGLAGLLTIFVTAAARSGTWFLLLTWEAKGSRVKRPLLSAKAERTAPLGLRSASSRSKRRCYNLSFSFALKISADDCELT